MKYVRYFILIFALLFIFNDRAFALDHDIYSNYDYVIDSYDVSIKVNENNTFDITETIDAYFNSPSHGIIRLIPLRNSILRNDGTKSYNRAVISNIYVNDNYSKSKFFGDLDLKIGSSDKEITGSKRYVIKYRYNIGKDPLKGKDELYFNIIGDNWDTVIGGISFRIEMPKAFDSSKLGFSAGSKGSIGTDRVKYNIKGNVISGTYDGVLDKNNALTVRLDLDDGYFVNAGFSLSFYNYITVLFSLWGLVISIYLWKRYGKDYPYTEVISFYPPKGLNSLDVGYIYNGDCDDSDVTSLLIYLADKGYLRIEEVKKESLLSSSDFKITKIKDYDGNDENEKLFMTGLFMSGDVVSNIDLFDSFYHTTNKIIHNIKSHNVYFVNNKKYKNIMFLMIFIIFSLITIIPVINYSDYMVLFFALVFPLVSFYVLCIDLSDKISINGIMVKSKVLSKLFTFFFSFFFFIMPFGMFIYPSIMYDHMYLFDFIIGMISIICIIFFYRKMGKRNEVGSRLYGEILGFRTFLKSAEKDKLEALVEDDPSYFYDILPYTYVLGVSDRWIKKFESINLSSPDWYYGYDSFDIYSFNSFMSSTMGSVNSSSDSVSSGFSGGGSAGSGSGGGGGTSW